jgi:two-component system, OmpR family, phosphate regulon sensor histidine kinase PhoR
MSIGDLEQLASLVERERHDLLARWTAHVSKLPSAHGLDAPALVDHVPALIGELVWALRTHAEQSIADALVQGTPPAHGQQRFADGFDIVEVVAEYNILRGCLHDLADQHGIVIAGQGFRILNRLLDEAIGLAVQTFASQQTLELQRRREEYLAFLAHDLRTPLSAIALAGRVLEHTVASGDAGEMALRMLRTLHRNVRHVEELVDKVLKESANVSVEAGLRVERRGFDLWPLVEELVQAMHPVASAAGAQLCNAVPEEITAFADASLVRRIFQNLVANAVRYAPRGEVVIGAKPLADDAVECWVSDNGAGIPPELLPTIFDEGQSDPETGGGAGLGLAIVKSFVEAHGGAVTVESEPGHGTAFRFTLPGRAR